MVSAQESPKYQDLLDAIESTDEWRERSVLYDSLVQVAHFDDQKTYRKYLNFTLSESKALDQHDFAAVYAFELSRSYRNLDTAIAILDETLLWDDKLSQAMKGTLLRGKGLAYYRANQKDSALYYYTLSSDVFEVLADSSQTEYGWAYLAAAGVQKSFGKMVIASKLIEKARLIFEFQKDTTFIILAMNDAAGLYGTNGFLEKAAEERERILEIADPDKNHRLVVFTYLNYSKEARDLGNDSLELALLHQSITLVDTTNANSMEYHFLGLHELVSTYGRRGNCHEVQFYFGQIEKLFSVFENKEWLMEKYRISQAEVLYCNGQYSNAIALAENINASAQANQDIETVMSMEQMLHRFYLAKQDYKNAYAHLANFQQLKDSISSIQKSNALLYLETQYGDEQKKRVISNQEHEIKLLATANAFQTKLVWVISISLLLLFGAIYLYRSRKYALNAKQLQEEFSQQLLSSHEDERKRISMDLHDSVGQSLMLIKNKIVLDQDEETINMVSQALEEVRSISKALHPVLLERLGLTASIQKLITDFDENTEILFTEEIDNIDAVFPEQQELHIFRIVQETISNMVKHAETPSALIQCSNEARKVTILIQDYGVGFDITNQSTFKSLGMKTLKERTQILGGRLVIDSEKGKGTTVLLEIPKKVK